MIYYIIGTILIIYIIFIIFLYLLKIKIKKFEINILNDFKEKNNLIPSIYETTKNFLNKHDEIFKDILILKKRDFSENNIYTKLAEKTNTYKLIHNELNFIFKISNTHQKLNKNYKYLFIKETIIEKSDSLGEKIKLYKKIVKQFNYMVLFKNITLIGLIIPIYKKETI